MHLKCQNGCHVVKGTDELKYSALRWCRQWNFPRGVFRWRYNERHGVSIHQPHDCLLNRLFRRISKETSKIRVTGLCAGNSPVTGEFPTHRASYAENVSVWWRHHDDNGSFILYRLVDPIIATLYLGKDYNNLGLLVLRIIPAQALERVNSSPPPLDKMVAISQTIFSDAFSWMKNGDWNFTKDFFLSVQLMIIQHWFR